MPRLALAVFLGIIVMAGLSLYADAGRVLDAFAGFRWAFVPGILALTLGNYMLRFVKWHYYLSVIDIKVNLKDSIAVFLSGLVMSITPAKMGEVFKSYLLKQRNGTDISRSMPVVFAERFTDVFGLLVLSALSFSAVGYGGIVLLVILALLIALTIAIQSRRIGEYLLSLSRRLPFLRRFSDNLGTLYESTYTLFRIRPLLIALVLSIVSWGMECIALYLVMQGLGTPVSLTLSTFIFSFSSMVGSLSMIPGGLLVAEGSMTGLLVLNDVTTDIAAGATIIIRIGTLWFGVLLGLITVALTGRRSFRISPDER